ncbi:MAG: UDP-N-acetylmuramoyl-tripeptide-D-alanyl-D-alanine ligase [candidate division TM6 bacterium GW2011_GWE2_42_60]|nr:MAG: UDP-N-acetylmuramoyl-tripeptide-D-alanyl-D-alanine ligase [candidate division TM6 bacterium GW2011_GWE2_42_60]
MRLDELFFTTVIPEAQFCGKGTCALDRCVVDSRLVKPGDLFIARKGTVVDGHAFVADAVKRGATGLMIALSQKTCLETLPAESLARVRVALVPDVERALFALAKAWRAQFTLPVVGVTGSIGKTTTKELIAEMVTKSGSSCLVSAGNYNTMVGASLTLLKLQSEHKCAVLEMGISLRGEMAQLADLIRPTFGVITTIAHQHMDGLGALAEIAAEKRAIFKYFKPDNIGFVNGDQSLLAGISYSHPLVKFGLKMTNQIQARRISGDGESTSCTLKLYGDRYQVTLPTPHRGRLTNALAAAAVAHFLNVPHQIIKEVLEEGDAVPGRFQSLRLNAGKGILINDAYNANPESMREALMAFDRLEVRGTKIAVLGDMLGLGANTVFWHRQLGRSLRKTSTIQRAIFVGEAIRAIEQTVPRGLQYQIVASWQEAAELLNHSLPDDGAILLKASHDIGLQNIATALVQQ